MKKRLLVVAALAAVVALWFAVMWHPAKNVIQTPAESFQPPPKTNGSASASENGLSHQSFSKLQSQWSDFTDAEKSEFGSNFMARYKPALKKWSDAFAGRVPISPDSVTTNNFVSRIGTRPIYREYIFVVEGITLGIQDAKGVARVDYLNAPKETGKMALLPTGKESPISTAPVSKDELVKLLLAEGGTLFKPNDIRLIPSGYSGALNGGAIVNVGGNPDNAASWKYDMVFGADGRLVYYLRGK